jgi:hypothetical protein
MKQKAQRQRILAEQTSKNKRAAAKSTFPKQQHLEIL